MNIKGIVRVVIEPPIDYEEDAITFLPLDAQVTVEEGSQPLKSVVASAIPIENPFQTLVDAGVWGLSPDGSGALVNTCGDENTIMVFEIPEQEVPYFGTGTSPENIEGDLLAADDEDVMIVSFGVHDIRIRILCGEREIPFSSSAVIEFVEVV